MRFDDVRNGVWHIRSEAREKGNGEQLRLPTMALEVLEEQQRLYPTSPCVFGRVPPLTRLRSDKLKFDARSGIAPWVLHDLRRTSRTLMAAAGVPDLVAELVLGHVQRGVAATYNRHNYLDEKADALEKLAAKLSDIVAERKAA